MIGRRFLLGFAVGVATLLVTGAVLILVSKAPVVASERPPGAPSVQMEAHLGSDPAPFEVLDQRTETGSASDDDAPESLAASRADGAGESLDYWLSSDPVPESFGPVILSPPDLSSLPSGLDEAATPLQTYNAYLRIAGAALKPRESSVEWTGVAGAGGCVYASSGNESAVFNAPVYLPQGATVKYFRMYYDDTHASSNSSAWFTVYDLYGVVQDEWGVSSNGDGGQNYGTTAEFTHTVDYASYSYVVNWRPYELGSDMQVCGFRIYYHTPPGPVFLPFVTSDPP